MVARNEGVVITFVPYKHRSGGNAVRVSVNPDKEGAVGKYSLKEVAEIYEQLEQIYEKQNKLNTGYFLGKAFLYDFCPMVHIRQLRYDRCSRKKGKPDSNRCLDRNVGKYY